MEGGRVAEENGSETERRKKNEEGKERREKRRKEKMREKINKRSWAAKEAHEKSTPFPSSIFSAIRSAESITHPSSIYSISSLLPLCALLLSAFSLRVPSSLSHQTFAKSTQKKSIILLHNWTQKLA